MSLVKHTDKRSGITYVYESESYWDKEKKQPRSKRTLVGKIDEETGEIVPTGGRGKKKASPDKAADQENPQKPVTDYVQQLAEKDELIRSLKSENQRLIKEKQKILDSLATLVEKWS